MHFIYENRLQTGVQQLPAPACVVLIADELQFQTCKIPFCKPF